MNSTIHTSDNLFCSNSSPILELSVKFASQICHENINKPLDGAYLADFGIDITEANLIFFVITLPTRLGVLPLSYLSKDLDSRLSKDTGVAVDPLSRTFGFVNCSVCEWASGMLSQISITGWRKFRSFLDHLSLMDPKRGTMEWGWEPQKKVKVRLSHSFPSGFDTVCV